MTELKFSPLDGKLMLVGIGAQKAGTSWLYRQLTRDPRVCMPVKELHFFDAVYRPEWFGVWPEIVFDRLRLQAGALARGDGPQVLDHCALLLDHARMMQDGEQYLPFFARRFGREHLVFGEITPSYATLDQDGLQAIRDKHPRVKLVFILRDPVARLISSVRHGKGLVGEEATTEDVLTALDDPAQVARCSYHLTLERLDKVFPEQDRYITFLEDIYTEAFAQDFGRFLGLEGFRTDVADRLNVSAPQRLLDAGQVEQMRRRLDHVYSYCRDRFGDRLPASWSA